MLKLLDGIVLVTASLSCNVLQIETAIYAKDSGTSRLLATRTIKLWCKLIDWPFFECNKELSEYERIGTLTIKIRTLAELDESTLHKWIFLIYSPVKWLSEINRNQ